MKSLPLIIIIVSLCAVFTIHAQPPKLTVFAAASLTDVLTEVGNAFSEQYDVEMNFQFGASSTLATQLIEGAEADLFISANLQQAQNLVDAGLVEGNLVTIARNRLVVIVPADNPANIQSLSDLAREGVLLAIAMPDVPVRGYTDQMVEAMRNDGEYGQPFFDGFYANVVIEGANVRQVVTQVALGESDAGVVYASDVTPDVVSDLAVLDVPDEFNVIADYPAVLLAGVAQSELAQEFIAFLLSDDGQDALENWGFISVRPQKSWGWVQLCDANPTWCDE